ncbi:MAG: hypothetical protein ACYS8Z_04235 [Planctomycetota bacterium]|jgi:hypothetical protein
MTCESNYEKTAQVELKVNGKKIELNAFVSNVIAESVMGMVKSLRGVDKIDTIELSIVKNAD